MARLDRTKRLKNPTQSAKIHRQKKVSLSTIKNLLILNIILTIILYLANYDKYIEIYDKYIHF